MPHKPLLLTILDGWGIREQDQHNPIANSSTPTFDELDRTAAHIALRAEGEHVGLPAGQIGNSEVGHLHLGAGRLIKQDLSRINEACDNNQLANNDVIQKIIQVATQTGARVHLIGLLSDGGVHSQHTHFLAMIDTLANAGVTNCFAHAFLDGRDVPPQSAEPSLRAVDDALRQKKLGYIASIIGRYYAMDRDQRYPRTQKAYNLLVSGQADYHANSVSDALAQAYARGETDEFVQATVVGEHAINIADGDIVVFMNFRADRARQLSYALTDPHFDGFQRQHPPQLALFATLTSYADNIESEVIFPANTVENTLGEVLATHGLSQLRLAETDKYAHVTYFFNGGREQALAGEERQLLPSPKVATYDLQPEMNAIALTDALVAAIESQRYDVIICNYANPDMVGHTGIEAAAQTAVQTIDSCMARVLAALKKVDGEALITADHGNIECMYDQENQQPHTAHTTNLVPLYFVGRHAKFNTDIGHLYDVAPTMLHLLGLTIPEEMTGKNLLED